MLMMAVEILMVLIWMVKVLVLVLMVRVMVLVLMEERWRFEVELRGRARTYMSCCLSSTAGREYSQSEAVLVIQKVWSSTTSRLEIEKVSLCARDLLPDDLHGM